MRYRLHPNVSLEKICGSYLLVASGEAGSRFNYVTVLNDVGAEILLLAQVRQNKESIIRQLADEYEMRVEDIQPGIIRFLEELQSTGYLIPVIGDEE